MKVSIGRTLEGLALNGGSLKVPLVLLNTNTTSTNMTRVYVRV